MLSYNDHSKTYRNYRRRSKRMKEGVSRTRQGKENRPFQDGDYPPGDDETLVLFTKQDGQRGFFDWSEYQADKCKRFYDTMVQIDAEENYYKNLQEKNQWRNLQDDDDDPVPIQKKPKVDREDKLLAKEADIERQIDEHLMACEKLEEELGFLRYTIETYRLNRSYYSDSDSDSDSYSEWTMIDRDNYDGEVFFW